MAHYRIRIAGLLPAASGNGLEQLLAGVFRLGRDEVEARLARCSGIWREGLDDAVAAKYCRVLRRHGIDCRIEPLAGPRAR